jgi:hypothetical protein
MRSRFGQLHDEQFALRLRFQTQLRKDAMRKLLAFLIALAAVVFAA